MGIMAKYGLYALIFFVVLALSAFLTTRVIVKGGPEVPVPDITGQDTIAALEKLSTSGLNLKVQGYSHSDEILKDRIISQDPATGTKVKKGRVIRVVISMGSKEAVVPDLKGLSLNQARSILSQTELTLGQVSYAFSWGAEQNRDRVMAQFPERLMKAGQAGRVDLLISLGPRPMEIVMPDMVGWNYGSVLTELERIGLRPGPLQYEANQDLAADAVVAHQPPAGAKIREGDRIILTVNRENAVE